MKLYNTLTRKTETFQPIDPQNVKVYTCGPTVYSYQHIGNFAAYIYWDTLIRTLRAHGYQENRVLNITDVGHLTSDADAGEDKMIKGAKREGKTVWQIAEYYTADFFDQFKKLNLIAPTKVTRATDYIAPGHALIDTLSAKGFTYQTSDGIYFDTSKFPTYAAFAKLNLRKQKAGARVDLNPEKRHPSDFALWKFIQPGQKHDMQWDSPQKGTQGGECVPPLSNKGYPGWHLECSSIIHTELAPEPIDIHTGGIDHIPVHHTNEIAQSQAAYDQPLANYWLHNNHITVDGTKISKSLGNVYTFSDLAKKGFTHLDYRMWVLQGHYQSERNFTFQDLAAAKSRLNNYRNFATLRHQSPPTTNSSSDQTTAAKTAIIAACGDNLNTPKALSHLDAAITSLSHPTQDFINFLDDLLGLNLAAFTPDITTAAKNLIAQRETAKTNKDFATADQIRKHLTSQGIALLDNPTGTTWHYL